MKVAEVDGVGLVYDGLSRSGGLLAQATGAVSAAEGAFFGALSAPSACDPVAQVACNEMINALVSRLRDLGEGLDRVIRAGRLTSEAFRAADGS